MTIETIREQLPEFAKDIKLNLGTITKTTVLNEQQLWGSLLASAAATKNPDFYGLVVDEAQEKLSKEAFDAALGAAAIMGMNNVFYRTRGYLDGKYDDLRPGLRMNIIANPGVDKSDFELWSIAVSAVNGCNHCVEAHEHALREGGVSREVILEAIKVAAIIAGAAQAYQLRSTVAS